MCYLNVRAFGDTASSIYASKMPRRRRYTLPTSVRICRRCVAARYQKPRKAYARRRARRSERAAPCLLPPQQKVKARSFIKSAVPSGKKHMRGTIEEDRHWQVVAGKVIYRLKNRQRNETMPLVFLPFSRLPRHVPRVPPDLPPRHAQRCVL